MYCHNVFQYLFFGFVNCADNPNVYDIRDKLNSLVLTYISVSYD